MIFDDFYSEADKTAVRERYGRLEKEFVKLWKAKPAAFFSSPARCEILGNHTDHNNGRVLVGAINRDIIACAAPNGGTDVTILSAEFGKIQVKTTELDYDKSEESTPKALVKGILAGFKQNGYRIGGFDALLDSNIPAGVGMSSSAAFELLVAVIINDFFNGGKAGKLQMAKIGKHAENVYFDKPCGLLDQCGVAYGGVTYIDFANPLVPYIETIEPPKLGKKMLIINTGGDHSGMTEHYAQIAADMGEVAKSLGRQYLGQGSDREFYALPEENTRRYKRALHFFEENQRVRSALSFLKLGDEEMFLICVANSGFSSRHKLGNNALPDEESSPITEAIDFIHSLDPEYAARVHGGGFRGTVLAFVEDNAEVLDKMRIKFGAENVYETTFRKSGAARVEIKEIFGE